MIEKVFTPKRTICKVTFKLPEHMASNKVALVGDFNEWDPTKNLLKKSGDTWQTTLRLNPDTEYKFRYFIDDHKWANDDTADGSIANTFGTEDSILNVGI
ncbi:MAG: isoamylase early set domain-containing protein [Balneolales bacterium]